MWAYVIVQRVQFRAPDSLTDWISLQLDPWCRKRRLSFQYAKISSSHRVVSRQLLAACVLTGALQVGEEEPPAGMKKLAVVEAQIQTPSRQKPTIGLENPLLGSSPPLSATKTTSGHTHPRITLVPDINSKSTPPVSPRVSSEKEIVPCKCTLVFQEEYIPISRTIKPFALPYWKAARLTFPFSLDLLCRGSAAWKKTSSHAWSAALLDEVNSCVVV